MIKQQVEDLTDDIKDYVNTRYELLELKAMDKMSVIGSEVISAVLISLFGFLFIAFISAAVGFYLSTLIGDRYSGFFIVAGFYLILGIVVTVFKKKIMSKPVKNLIVKEMFEEEKLKNQLTT
jgi:hypothetical protein